MQSTHKISGDAASGFAAYLTAGASRGDYYAGGQADGELGRWHGSSRALGELGLERGGAVERDDLVTLMEGRSPRSGDPIRRVGGDGSRVAGIDVTFSAPKSVSALWAVSDPYRRAQIEAAHRKAVESAVERIETDVELVRRREHGQLRWEAAESLVAAEFVHTSSRLTRDQETDGVPDPQLHSHVLVVAAERQDGAFAAVDSRELFRAARGNGAWYRAELAYQLGELGLEVRGRTGNDGRYFEVDGVPEGLSRRWSSRAVDVERAAQRFRERYGRAPRAGELGAMTVQTRGTKTVAAQVDVDAAWRAVGEEYSLGHERAEGLFADRARHSEHAPDAELLAAVTSERSMISARELEARAFELAAGAERPAEARERARGLARSGELVELEGGWWTTRELREREQRTLTAAVGRAQERVAPVSDAGLRGAEAAAHAAVGSPLSAEQRDALEIVTGAGGVTALVGQAGTGKGVVIGAAREALEAEGHRVFGTAIAGATAKRLESEAGIDRTFTADALLHREAAGRIVLSEGTVVVVDEAGMADTDRLARLIETGDRTGAKLVLVGDPAQLSALGAGGLFAALAGRVPTAELSEVYRARNDWERDAWRELRDGNAGEALAAYHARDRLHLGETRVEAGERMVEDWARARRERPQERVVMLTDASNEELDRINALAQAQRAGSSEIGQHHVELPGRPYALHGRDEIVFNAQLHQPGAERIENGTTGKVLSVNDREQRVRVRTAEPTPRDVEFSTTDFSDVRLAYAQHVYKAQGMTADRALVLTGGWQTDRERAYVALTRARERTDVYLARDDLGAEGLDDGAIARLSERISKSRAQEASIARPEIDWGSRPRTDVGRALEAQRQRERERDHDRGYGFEL